MFRSLAIVLALVVGGQAAVAWLDLPVPGPALGLLLLTVWFGVCGGPDAGTGKLFDTLMPHVPALFVPAAVGVVGLSGQLAQGWVAVAAAIVGGTALTLVATGQAVQRLLAPLGARGER
jgi:holin-like protein